MTPFEHACYFIGRLTVAFAWDVADPAIRAWQRIGGHHVA